MIPGAAGLDFCTEYSQGAFGCTSQHASETASHYQRNSQPWQIIPYYFLKENIKSVSCVSVKFFFNWSSFLFVFFTVFSLLLLCYCYYDPTGASWVMRYHKGLSFISWHDIICRFCFYCNEKIMYGAFCQKGCHILQLVTAHVRTHWHNDATGFNFWSGQRAVELFWAQQSGNNPNCSFVYAIPSRNAWFQQMKQKKVS